VLLLAALAAQAFPAPTQPNVAARATATVRIERPSTASSMDCDWTPQPKKRVVFVGDEVGRPLLLRLVENQ
jgi:hypothetical protein